MGFIGDMISGITGGIFDFAGQESANSANMAIAQKQMDFQREMSNTSWQRGVKDMRAAGINPMLAYSQGGASTPGGAAIPVGNVGAAAVQGATQAVGAYNSARSTNADVSLKTLQNDNVKQQTQNLKQQQGQIMANSAAAYAQAEASTTQAQANSARAALDAANTEVAEANAKSVHIDNALKALAIPAATNSAAKANTWFGRNVTPYINDVLGGGILNSISKFVH